MSKAGRVSGKVAVGPRRRDQLRPGQHSRERDLSGLVITSMTESAAPDAVAIRAYRFGRHVLSFRCTARRAQIAVFGVPQLR